MFDRIHEGRYWDKPWGLVSSCTRCSPGCRGCWALALQKRFHRGIEGKIEVHPERLDIPLKRKKPTVFALWNDCFHEDVSDFFIASIYGVASVCPEHIFLILTKRAKRMARWYEKQTNYLNWVINEACVALPDIQTFGIRLKQKRDWPLPNVWLGVTVCNQQEADEKIPLLLQIPAAVRWVSIEPMLGPIDFDKTCGKSWCWRGDLDWVVLGGETGPGARPMDSDWALSIKDQCVDAGVPFFFKAWGTAWGKHVGRLMDGLTWDEIPEVK